MLEEKIACKNHNHHKKIMISYVREANLHMNQMISTKALTKFYKSIVEEKQQFIQLLQCLF